MKISSAVLFVLILLSTLNLNAAVFVHDHAWNRDITLTYTILDSVDGDLAEKIKTQISLLNNISQRELFRKSNTPENAEIRFGMNRAHDKLNHAQLGRRMLSVYHGVENIHFFKVDNEIAQTTIAHELLHALSFAHEHSSPQSNLYQSSPLQYTSDKERRNRFSGDPDYFNSLLHNTKILNDDIIAFSYSIYDPYSIMHYYMGDILNGLEGASIYTTVIEEKQSYMSMMDVATVNYFYGADRHRLSKDMHILTVLDNNLDMSGMKTDESLLLKVISQDAYSLEFELNIHTPLLLLTNESLVNPPENLLITVNGMAVSSSSRQSLGPVFDGLSIGKNTVKFESQNSLNGFVYTLELVEFSETKILTEMNRVGLPSINTASLAYKDHVFLTSTLDTKLINEELEKISNMSNKTSNFYKTKLWKNKLNQHFASQSWNDPATVFNLTTATTRFQDEVFKYDKFGYKLSFEPIEASKYETFFNFEIDYLSYYFWSILNLLIEDRRFETATDLIFYILSHSDTAYLSEGYYSTPYGRYTRITRDFWKSAREKIRLSREVTSIPDMDNESLKNMSRKYIIMHLEEIIKAVNAAGSPELSFALMHRFYRLHPRFRSLDKAFLSLNVFSSPNALTEIIFQKFNRHHYFNIMSDDVRKAVQGLASEVDSFCWDELNFDFEPDEYNSRCSAWFDINEM